MAGTAAVFSIALPSFPQRIAKYKAVHGQPIAAGVGHMDFVVAARNRNGECPVDFAGEGIVAAVFVGQALAKRKVAVEMDFQLCAAHRNKIDRDAE